LAEVLRLRPTVLAEAVSSAAKSKASWTDALFELAVDVLEFVRELNLKGIKFIDYKNMDSVL
jgi:hypothetical protein